MSTFLIALGLFTGGLLLASIPVVVVAIRERRPATARRFLLGAVVVGLSCALVTVTSKELVESCQAAGNSRCIDYGADGFKVMLVAGFVLVALARAYVIHNE